MPKIVSWSLTARLAICDRSSTSSGVTVLAYDTKAAEAYGDIRADLEQKGRVIGQLDMLIAGHAKSCGYTIVTNNVGEFERVDGLVVEDWINE